ncbi:MAG: universal stress protein [Candidatus Obscuribacterales bacterium]|nr:universal stress protein [Candidatus Obscuribacterales bacterium]
MKGKSILLALSGSQQSRFATEVCWNLARRLGSKITAHHVIDSHSAWEFLGHENPGFLESSRYLEAYQELLSRLFTLGEELSRKYATEAKALGIDDICLVDEGNPINEICRRAANHKLVVIGHKASKKEQPRSQFQRLSVAEALAHDCPRPLLIVQDECKHWSSLSIMISPDHINEIFINSCLDMAAALCLPATLVCLTGGAHEERPNDLVRDLRASNERLKEIPIALTPAKQEIEVSTKNCYAPEGQKADTTLWENPLIVIPTRMVGGERITVVDSSPSLFVRFLSLPSIMLWPEEYLFSTSDDESAKQVAGSRS